jgi:glyoxylase-like metal-dependent hydrolase (beta-lactamase superfamily II)
MPAERILFTGDAAASVGNPIIGVFNVDPAQAKDSFRRMSSLDFETAAFGHGPPIAAGAAEAFRKLTPSTRSPRGSSG